MKHLTDKQIISSLRSSDKMAQNTVFVFLHEAMHEKFRQFILKRGGQQEDAEDLLQEGLLVLYKLARQEKLEHINSVPSYLFTICKNLWFKSSKSVQQTVEVDEVAAQFAEEPTVLRHLMDIERTQILQKLLGSIGDNCRQLLTLFYYHRLSMKEILQKMHYASEAALKNKKSKCMKSLREQMQESDWLQQFMQ